MEMKPLKQLAANFELHSTITPNYITLNFSIMGTKTLFEHDRLKSAREAAT